MEYCLSLTQAKFTLHNPILFEHLKCRNILNFTQNLAKIEYHSTLQYFSNIYDASRPAKSFERSSDPKLADPKFHKRNLSQS